MSATIPTPATTQLAKALRAVAEDMAQNHPDPASVIDQAELLRCFARLLEGKDLDKAMGTPGGWGYGTPIGEAVYALLNEDGEAPRLGIPDESASIKWTHVEDTLPDADTTVLVALENEPEIWIGYLGDENTWRNQDAAAFKERVYAWAELPAAPEQKKGGA